MGSYTFAVILALGTRCSLALRLGQSPVFLYTRDTVRREYEENNELESADSGYWPFFFPTISIIKLEGPQMHNARAPGAYM